MKLKGREGGGYSQFQVHHMNISVETSFIRQDGLYIYWSVWKGKGNAVTNLLQAIICFNLQQLAIKNEYRQITSHIQVWYIFLNCCYTSFIIKDISPEI
jgi:hypothetical protein